MDVNSCNHNTIQKVYISHSKYLAVHATLYHYRTNKNKLMLMMVNCIQYALVLTLAVASRFAPLSIRILAISEWPFSQAIMSGVFARYSVVRVNTWNIYNDI